MVRDLVAGDVPVGDEGEVGVVDGVVVGHLGRAAVGVFAVGEELVDGVEGVALDGIVGGEDDEHGRVGLASSIRTLSACEHVKTARR